LTLPIFMSHAPFKQVCQSFIFAAGVLGDIVVRCRRPPDSRYGARVGGAKTLKLFHFNRLTAMVAYLRPLFFLASYELNNFLNFCPLSTFDS
jgi:hypothetical protein